MTEYRPYSGVASFEVRKHRARWGRNIKFNVNIHAMTYVTGRNANCYRLKFVERD